MKHEIVQLQRENSLYAKIMDALATEQDPSAILQRLETHQDLRSPLATLIVQASRQIRRLCGIKTQDGHLWSQVEKSLELYR